MKSNDKIFQDAVAFLDTRRLPDAERDCNEGTSLRELKRYDEALVAYERALAIEPDLAAAWLGRGKIFILLKRYDEAFAAFDQALALKPDFAEAWFERGKIFTLLKRYDEAFGAYDKALAFKQDFAQAWLGRGNVFTSLKRYDEAFAAYDNALAIKPDLAGAWNGRGNVFNSLKRFDEAFGAYDKALSFKPDLAEAWLGRGNVFSSLKRYDEAFAAYDKALAVKPDLAQAWLGRGNVLTCLKRYAEALAAYDNALLHKPDLAEAWLGRGNVFYNLWCYEAALTAYDKALTFESDLAEAWLGRGNVFNQLKRHDEAAGAYANVLKTDSQFPFVKGKLLHQKMLSCDWKDMDNLIAEIDRDVALGRLSAEPFGWQGVTKSQRSLQLCAQLYNKEIFPTNIRISNRQFLNDHRKVRIGYLSGELRDQPTSQLIIGVLERHDHSRFEIYGIDNGWDDQSEIRKRINGSVNSIINIRHLTDELAVAVIQNNEIDILVNLNGYFGKVRMEVFARRCSPIQVNYLGFPGTLGADYIDYIIADQHVIPKTHKQFYTEKIVYLPHCYQANDDRKKIGTNNCARAEFGLPEEAFIFCCFNNNYKIVPNVFECWMRIIKQIEDSVLWLIADNAAASSNLRKEAVARGISAERLVFTERMPLPDHLARHRLADLFLDTLPYNAHTTGSDALWAGLPVLTQIGETFAGRVAASLLHAIGLPELITRTQEEYERLAIELAIHPTKLALIKEKLAQNRLTTPLFNTQLFTRHIESAYEGMYERYQENLPPDHIYVHSCGAV